MSMFKANTIGDRINSILKKHGEDVFDGVTFEDQVKNSSTTFKNICTLNKYDPERKDYIFNPYNNKSEIVERWIAFIHYELLMMQMFKVELTKYDLMVIDSIKTALMLEYNEIYYNYFD